MEQPVAISCGWIVRNQPTDSWRGVDRPWRFDFDGRGLRQNFKLIDDLGYDRSDGGVGVLEYGSLMRECSGQGLSGHVDQLGLCSSKLWIDTQSCVLPARRNEQESAPQAAWIGRFGGQICARKQATGFPYREDGRRTNGGSARQLDPFSLARLVNINVAVDCIDSDDPNNFRLLEAGIEIC